MYKFSVHVPIHVFVCIIYIYIYSGNFKRNLPCSWLSWTGWCSCIQTYKGLSADVLSCICPLFCRQIRVAYSLEGRTLKASCLQVLEDGESLEQPPKGFLSPWASDGRNCFPSRHRDLFPKQTLASSWPRRKQISLHTNPQYISITVWAEGI